MKTVRFPRWTSLPVRLSRFSGLPFLAVAVILSATSAAQAADRFWDGSTTDFNTSSNWLNGIPPTTADRAVFATADTSVVLSATSGVNQMMILTPGFVLSGTTLGLNGTNQAIWANTTGTTTISSPITYLGAATAKTFDAVLGGELVISGNIGAGASLAGLTKGGHGVLTLSGNNTFTGTVNLNGPGGNFGISRTNINSDTALGTGPLAVGTGNGGTTLGNTSGADHTLANAVLLSASSGATTRWDLSPDGTGDLTFTGTSNIVGSANANHGLNVIGGTLTFAAGLGQTNTGLSLTKNGTGTLVLGGVNAYTGNTNLAGGTLVLDRSAPGSSFASTILGGTNAVLVLKGASAGATNQTFGNYTFGGQSGIVVNGNGGTTSLTLGNTWTRGGGSTLNIVLETADSFLTSSPTTGATGLVFGSGTVAFATVTDSTGATGFATVSGGNVVRYIGASTLAAATNSTGTNYITAVSDPDYSGGTITMGTGTYGVGTLQVDTNAGAGTMNLNSGTMIFGSRGLLVTGSNNYTVSNGQLGANTSELVIHQFSTGTLILNSKIGGLTKDGAGTIALNNVNTSGAVYTINDGVLDVNGRIGTGGLVINGATETKRGVVNLRVAASATNGSITVQGAGILNTLAVNAISGNASLNLGTASTTGPGFAAIANLNQANNYTGNTTLNAGRLNIGDAGAIGTGTLTFGGGTLDNSSGGALTLSTNNNMVFATNGSLQFFGSSALNLGTGTILMNTGASAAMPTIAVYSSTLTFGGNMFVTGSGGGGFTKIGVGTLALSGSNNFASPITGINSGSNGVSGVVTVQSGVLLLQSNYALSGGIGATGGSANLALDGGVVGLGAGNFSRTIGTGTSDFQISANGGGFAAYGANRQVDVGGGGVGSTVTWGGTGWNDSAILMLSSAGSDATVEMVNSINLSAAAGTKDRIVRVENGSAKVDARLSGVLANGSATVANVIKAGAGTLELTNVNTYNGSTYVAAGTLMIGGAGSINSSSSVSVAGGATLAYNSSTNLTATANFAKGSTLAGTNWNGSLGGVTVSSLGGGPSFITPGNSPGNAFTTTQTWGTGGGYIWEINDFSGGAGLNPGWDLLTLSGALTISATSVDKFNIFITSLNGDNSGQAANFNDLSTYQLLIADAGSTITTFDASLFNVVDAGFLNPFTGDWSIMRGDNASVIGGDDSQLYLVYTAIPEPSALILFGLGGMSMLFGRRRRKA